MKFTKFKTEDREEEINFSNNLSMPSHDDPRLLIS